MMDQKNFIVENKKVFSTLSDFVSITNHLPNIILLGSIGLIAHTQKTAYFRKIKDIDIIASSAYQEEVEKKLYEKSYVKSTFISDNMPFSRLLKRFSESKYTRFYREDSADLEILFTPFHFKNNSLEIELFPQILMSIPTSEIVKVQLLEVTIKTLSAEAMLAVKTLSHKTLGKIYKKDFEKRVADHNALLMCVNPNKYNEVSKLLKFKLGPFRIPLLNLLRLQP